MAIFVIAEGNLFTKFPKGVFSFTMATKQRMGLPQKEWDHLVYPPSNKNQLPISFHSRSEFNPLNAHCTTEIEP
jgi:hypothetical protein